MKVPYESQTSRMNLFRFKKLKHIAQIRPAIVPDESKSQIPSCESSSIPKSYPADFSTAISLDPDGMLSSESRNKFRDIIKCFKSVFNPNFGVYIDKCGPIRVGIKLDSVEPPTQKRKLPFYNQENLQQLQGEADKLENLGLLARMCTLTSNLFLLPSS